jgi:hypothetical protein
MEGYVWFGIYLVLLMIKLKYLGTTVIRLVPCNSYLSLSCDLL